MKSDKYNITITFRLPSKCEAFLYPNVTKVARQCLEDEMERNIKGKVNRNFIKINTTDPAGKAYSLKVSEQQMHWLRRYAGNDDRTPGGVIRLLILRAFEPKQIYGKTFATQNLSKLKK